MNDKLALALILQHGIYGLGGSDGCRCTHFFVQGIWVDVSCHKSEHSVRVYSDYLERDPLALEPIAREVLRQIARSVESWGTPEEEAIEIASRYRIRFCDFSTDNVNGRREGEKYVWDHKCSYCGKPRLNAAAYLCDDCLKRPEAVSCYPWTADGFMSPECALLAKGRLI